MELTIVLAALKVVGYGLAAIGPGIGIGIATYGMSEALALLGLVLFFIG